MGNNGRGFTDGHIRYAVSPYGPMLAHMILCVAGLISFSVVSNEVYGLTNRQCPPKLKRRIPSTHDFCALGQGFGINHCMRIDARHDTEMEGGGVKALHREWATTIASALSCEEHCLVEVMLPSGEQEDAFCGSSELFNLYGLRGWTEATSVAGASPVDE